MRIFVQRQIFFFENEHGEAVTVNGDRYRAMLKEFLFTEIEEGIGNIWFQQEGATCNTAAELMLFGQLEVVIRHRWTISWGELSKITVTPISQRQLTL